MKIEKINGVLYYNVFGLYHRIRTEDEIKALTSEQQFLECLGQNMAQQALLEQEKSQEEIKA